MSQNTSLQIEEARTVDKNSSIHDTGFQKTEGKDNILKAQRERVRVVGEGQ